MSIFNVYKPLIFELKKNKLNDIDYNIEFSNDNSYPLIKLGHNHFNFQNLIKYNDAIKSNEKKIENLKLYGEEFSIIELSQSDENKSSIINSVNQFINKINKDIPKINNNYFTQIWEMILYFDLMPNKIKKIKTMHITDKHSYFVEGCIIYRLFINQKLNSDEFILSNEDDNDFLKYFEKNIKNKYTKNSVDLITTEIYEVDGEKILSESKSFKTILKQLYTILDAQKNDGDLVLKIYDTYTFVSLNMIEFIRSFYEKSYICKPFTSLKINSERYLVCKFFKSSQLKNSIMSNIKKLIEIMDKNEEFKIFSLMNNLHIEKKSIELYKKMSIDISTNQYTGINNMFNYLLLDNKNGSEFHEIIKNQEEATEFWISTFLNKKNFDKILYK